MKVGRTFRYAALCIALAVSGYPLVWMLLTALRVEGDALDTPFGLPLVPVFDSVAIVLRSGAFGRAYLNSVVVCGLSVVVAVTVGAMAAYGLARLRPPGRVGWYLLFMAGMMVPVHVTLVPLNHLLGPAGLGLKGTMWALIGPYVGFALPVTIAILHNAFAQLPEEFFEAARIDGCSQWRTFTSVALPLARPAIATVAIFNALTMWNEFAFALTLVVGEKNRTLPLALWQFRGEHGMYVTQTCAALCVTVVPMLVLYVFAQRHIIKGLTAGAMK